MKSDHANESASHPLAVALVLLALLTQAACATEGPAAAAAAEPPHGETAARESSAPRIEPRAEPRLGVRADDHADPRVAGQTEPQADARLDARTEPQADARDDRHDDPRDDRHADARTDVDELLEHGEAAYRARRFDDAALLFERLVALRPDHVHAWLRLGNLHHQRRDWFKALAAYRRVASRGGADGNDPALRAKALFNVALINLELARQTLRTLERMGPIAAVAGRPQPLVEAIDEVRRRLDRFGLASPTARPASAPSTRARTPSPAGPPSARASASRRRGSSRDAVPQVDYIRGEPRP